MGRLSDALVGRQPGDGRRPRAPPRRTGREVPRRPARARPRALHATSTAEQRERERAAPRASATTTSSPCSWAASSRSSASTSCSTRVAVARTERRARRARRRRRRRVRGSSCARRRRELGIDDAVRFVGLPRGRRDDARRRPTSPSCRRRTRARRSRSSRPAAAGLPLVSTDVGGVRDVVAPGTGELVASGDAPGWAPRSPALATDPTRRRACGQAAQRHVLARVRRGAARRRHRRPVPRICSRHAAAERGSGPSEHGRAACHTESDATQSTRCLVSVIAALPLLVSERRARRPG